MQKKPILVLLILTFLLTCTENKKKKSLLFTFGLLGNTSTPTKSSPNGSGISPTTPPVTTSPVSSPQDLTMPDDSIQVNSGSQTKTLFPILPLNQVEIGYLYGTTQPYEMMNQVPPEGSTNRFISFVIGEYLDCSSVKPVNQNPTLTGEHIQNITVWKKNSNGEFVYVPGKLNCNLELTSSTGNYSAGPVWEKDGFPVNKLYNRDFSNLAKSNENWLDPNATYRIYISQNLKDKQGTKLSEYKPFDSKIKNITIGYRNVPNSGSENSYHWFEFKTLPASCVKTYYDWTAQYYDFFDVENPDNFGQTEIKNFGTSYTLNGLIPTGVFAASHEILITNRDLWKKSKLEICNAIPETCLPGVNYLNNNASVGLFQYYPKDYAYKLESLGVCIKNPGKSNEYAVSYSTYFNLKVADLKRDCSNVGGIWRSAIAPMTMLNFQETRCGYKPTTGGNGDGENSCNPARGTIDFSYGNWFNSDEVKNTNSSQKRINKNGVHTYWDEQKIIYKIKKNCKEGIYNLSIKAKNVFGPLPSDYKTFKLTIKNLKDGKVYKMEINASDLKYNSSSVKLFIDKGDTDLEIVWTNDAYLEKVYDANIQIKNVNLKYLDK